MFDFVGKYLFFLMEMLNTNIVHSFALAVVISTVVLKLITLPLDIRQHKNTKKTRQFQPELNEIRERYKNNPETLQKKTSEFNKKHGINMLAGCLPMIVTMIVFMAFLSGVRLWGDYQTARLYVQTSRMTTLSEKEEFFKKYKMGWIANIMMPDSGMSPLVMKYDDFKKIRFEKLDRLMSQEDIAELQNTTQESYESTLSFIPEQYPNRSNGWFILPLLAGLSSLLMQILSMTFNPQQAANAGAGSGAGGMSKGMMYAMSGVSVFVCISSNAAFALYWLTSNIAAIAVTLFVNADSIHLLLPKKKEA